MGTVWRAEDELLGRRVAVKEVVFPPGTSGLEAEALRERTRREARSAARLDHPSAVTVFDVVEEDGRPWLVMELVEARTLADVVRESGPLPPARVADIGLAVLGALEAAHKQGIVHRDVKPGNVLLGAPERTTGRVVLTDFGIAMSIGEAALTSTGLILGSPAYISPERARGHAPGPASDLWALGATLYAAAQGRPPYDGADPVETVTLVVRGAHDPYSGSTALAAALDGLLDKDPERRLTAPEARALLLRAAAEKGPAVVGSAAPPAPVPRTSDRTVDLPRVMPARKEAAPRVEPRVRGRVWAALLVAVLLVLGGVVGYLVTSDDGGGTSAGPRRTPTPSATADGRPAGVPGDWVRYADPAGWSVWTPPGYATGSYRDAAVQLRDDANRRSLRIWVVPGTSSPAALVTQREGGFKTLGTYVRLGLDTGSLGTDPTTTLEFSYVDGGVPLHVSDTVVVVDGVGYELYWQVNSRDWTAATSVRDQVLASFRPAP
jgi:hypothetical protein